MPDALNNDFFLYVGRVGGEIVTTYLSSNSLAFKASTLPRQT